MSMEHWWNDTDRGNWSARRKTLFSLGGRGMNKYGTIVDWYWQGKQVLGEKRYSALVVDEWMSMEQWWNATDKGKWNARRKTLYSVGGRWMNEYGAVVDWYWRGKTSAGRKTLYIVVGRWMIEYGALVERWKLTYWEKNITQIRW